MKRLNQQEKNAQLYPSRAIEEITFSLNGNPRWLKC